MSHTLQGTRILVVLNDLTLGGSERQALLLARRLAAGGAHVTVAGLAMPGAVMDACEAAGIPCVLHPLHYGLSVFYFPWNCLRMLLLLWQTRPDAILAYTCVPNLYTAMTWRLSRARCCAWGQRDTGCRGRPPRLLERLAARLASVCIANSAAAARFLSDEVGVPDKRIRVVPNGVELPPPERSPDGWRTTLNIDAAAPVACMVGHLRAPKDVHTLWAAWQRVVARRPPPRPVLLLAGRVTPAFEPLTREIAASPVASTVRILGERSDIAGLLATADIGVFSSRSEGLPNGVLECMAAGLPVAATDLPGIRECLDAPQHEFLAKPGDDEGLAVALERLLDSAALRHALGTANRRRIESHFNPATMTDRTAAILTACLDKQPLPRP